jgi:hypothetical protein
MEHATLYKLYDVQNLYFVHHTVNLYKSTLTMTLHNFYSTCTTSITFCTSYYQNEQLNESKENALRN